MAEHNHQPVTYRDFSALARRRNWIAESLAKRFKGMIEAPSEFFQGIMSGKHPDVAIPFRSVLTFYSEQLRSQNQLDGGRPVCACGCGRIVFDGKNGLRQDAERKPSAKLSVTSNSGSANYLILLSPNWDKIGTRLHYP